MIPPPHLKDAHMAAIGLEPSPIGDLNVTGETRARARV